MIIALISIVLFIFGFYFLIQPKNFLTSRLMLTEYSTTYKKKYGQREAERQTRILGLSLITFSLIFYFFFR